MGRDFPHMDLSFTVEDVTVSPLLMVRKLGIILGDGLSCTPSVTAVPCSWRFAFFWSFFTKDATQLLVQAQVISCLDYCNSLLAGLPTSWLNCCNVSNTLQGTSFTMYPNSSMWPPSSSTFTYIHTYIHTSAGRLVLPSLRANKTHSAQSPLFYVMVSQWWNKLPTNVTLHLPQKTQDSFVQTLPQPHIAWLAPNPAMHLYVHIISTSMIAFMHLKYPW